MGSKEELVDIIESAADIAKASVDRGDEKLATLLMQEAILLSILHELCEINDKLDTEE